SLRASDDVVRVGQKGRRPNRAPATRGCPQARFLDGPVPIPIALLQTRPHPKHWRQTRREALRAPDANSPPEGAARKGRCRRGSGAAGALARGCGDEVTASAGDGDGPLALSA